MGLASYGIEHAGVFFGRDELTGELLERLFRGRFLAVFGPSGSGKSSLLRAGLLAAVRRGEAESTAGWETVLLTPGEQPLASLAGHVAALSGIPAQRVLDGLLAGPEGLSAALARVLETRPAGAEVVLVVDQFEELFTICHDRADRDDFVHALLAAAASDVRVRLVLGIRADFYAQCAAWPELVTALRDAQVLVGPMDHDQLRDVIVKPAQQAGVAVDSALVATAIAETGAEPGALAMVSHALLEAWRHSPPGRLTLAAYQEAGGVAHAIATTAERLYAGCGDDERRQLRRILLRLVALGDGGPDTRRRVSRGELAGESDPGAADVLVERLVQARLVTADEGAVQLAHEALIRFWPRLAEWLAQGRESLQLQRRIADAASEWASHGRDPAILYRGTPLALARAWAERDGYLTGLTPVEREFLGASSVAANRAARRRRVLAAVLIVLLAAVGGAGWTAAWQRESALSNANAAVSGQLAVQSAALATGNPDAAVLAALAAWSAGPTPAARSALLSTIGCCGSAQASLPGSYAGIQAVALSPDGKLLAAGGKDTAVHLWDTSNGRQIAILRGPAGQVRALAISTGGLIAAGFTGPGILLWNPARRVPERVLAGGTGTIEDLAFSPDGRLLASASDDGQIRLWNPATSQGELLLPRPGQPMLSVAFSPDGRTLAAGGEDRAVARWDISDASRPRALPSLTGASEPITTLLFSPRGTLLAGQQQHGGVLLWHLGRDTPVTILPPAAKGTPGFGFSRDDSILLTVTYNEMRLWDTGTGRRIATYDRRIPGVGQALAYDPASGILALAGGAGVMQLWQNPIPPFTGSTAGVTGLAAIPGEPLVTSVSRDDTARLWRGDGGLTAVATLPGQPDAVAASPDGKRIATATADGAITVRALPGLGEILRLQIARNARATGADLAFSPDSRLLATSAGHAVTLWDAASGAAVHSFLAPGNIDRIVFSPVDSGIAAVTAKGQITIWNTRTGQVIAEASASSVPLDAVAFSRTGLLATGGDDGNIRVWDPRNLRHPLVYPGPGGPVHALAFSPDGHDLAAAGTSGTITLWDTRNWSEIATLTSGDHSVVRALAFGPAGSTLMSGDDSGRIIAWSLDPRTVIRADCQMLARDPGLGQAAAMVPRVSYSRLCPAGGS